LSLQRGDRVFLNASVLNRDPTIYEEPDVFLPERWLRTASTGYRPLAFSAGPRRCLGHTFALAVIRQALRAIMEDWRIELAQHARIGLKFAITQAPTSVPIIASRSQMPPLASRFIGPAMHQMSLA
jgi:cytochrome P450